MKHQDSPKSDEMEVIETLETANKIIDFYEELLSTQSGKLAALEAENSKLQELLTESKELLKDVLRTPTRSVIN